MNNCACDTDIRFFHDNSAILIRFFGNSAIFIRFFGNSAILIRFQHEGEGSGDARYALSLRLQVLSHKGGI